MFKIVLIGLKQCKLCKIGIWVVFRREFWVLFLKYCSLMIEFFKNILEKVFDSLKIIF